MKTGGLLTGGFGLDNEVFFCPVGGGGTLLIIVKDFNNFLK